MRSGEDSGLGWESDYNSRFCNVYPLCRQDCGSEIGIGLVIAIDFCSGCGAGVLVLGFVRNFEIGDLPEVILLDCDLGSARANGPEMIAGTWLRSRLG